MLHPRAPSLQTAANFGRGAPYGPWNSNRTVDGQQRGRSMEPPIPPMPTTADILVDVFHSLQQISSAMQQQNIDKSSHYCDPFELLPQLDPGLKAVVIEWHKDYLNLLKDLGTQETLSDKYAKICRDGAMLTQFKSVHSKTWQWLDSYKASAQPLDLQADRNFVASRSHIDTASGTSAPTLYDIDKSFGEMCMEHAKLQHNFIVEHQKKQLEMFEPLPAISSRLTP